MTDDLSAPPGAPPDDELLALIARIRQDDPPAAVMSPLALELATALARPWAELPGRLAARQFDGPETGRPVHYLVYEPAGYDDGAAQFPVLYHFHGMKPFPQWTPLAQTVLMREANRVAAALEAAVAAASVPPLLLIFPFAYGDTFWADSQAGDRPAATNFMQELEPHIAATYRVIPDRSARLLQGYSMGGFGALTLAAAHPEKFSLALSYDGAFHNWASLTAKWPALAAAHFGAERAFFEPFSPWIHLAEKVGAIRDSVGIYLNVGELSGYHGKLTAYLRYLEIPYSEVMTTCGHDLDCLLTTAGPASFAWIGQRLAGL